MAQESSAANAWVESYLNALLTFGLSSEYAGATAEPPDARGDADRSVYSRYYVRSLLNLDEEALNNAWRKAVRAGRHGNDTDARMEFLSWRIWHLKRKHAERQRVARLHGPLDEDEATMPQTPGDYSSDEEGGAQRAVHDGLAPGPQLDTAPIPTSRLSVKIGGASFPPADAPAAAIDSFLEEHLLSPVSATQHGATHDRLYIVMISLHGLVRGERMELGKDSDTGGQVKYVVELARALSLHPAVHRVDLLTRLIRDPSVAPEYGEEEECLCKGRGERGGAYIVRLPCGPTEQYVRKELLWPHIREFADRGIAHVSSTLAALAEAGRRCDLYCVHGHYADAGEAAVLMCHALDTPLVVTGHSLGRNKLEHLLKSSNMSRAEIEGTYAISRRIEAEERCLDTAAMVFTSTQQEIDEQWGLYDGFDPQLARVLRFRRSAGRHMPLMKVSPPGLDFSSLKVDIPPDPVLREFEQQRALMEQHDLSMPLSPTAGLLSPSKASLSSKDGDHMQMASSAVTSPTGKAAAGGSSPTVAAPGGDVSQPQQWHLTTLPNAAPIWQEIARFLKNPLKPAVLAMSRPDSKKNLTTLVKAFGEHAMLRELANLVLIMGNRDDIDCMASGSQKVLVHVLKLIDAYDLYGSVAYPKHHSQSDISDIYLFAAETRGVFVNIALQEPFGLTVIEAAAHGVPTVATCNGGPVDIMATLHHGVVVEPTDSDAVAAALLDILTVPATWDQMSGSGVGNIMAYSWPAHCKRYMEAIDVEKRFARSVRPHERSMSGMLEKRLSRLDLLGLDSDVLPSAAHNPRDPTPGEMLQRHFSTPGALTPPLEMSATASPLPGRRISGLSTDDLSVLHSLHAEALQRHAVVEAAAYRSRFVIFHLDSDKCVAGMVEAMRNVSAALAAAGLKEDVGLGVLSMLGFDSTSAHLRDSGLGLDGVDLLVCNSGADVWMRREGGSWDACEPYEGIIEWEWDRNALHRMLQKIIAAPTDNHRRRLPRFKELLYNVAEEPETRVHPRHICIELDPETQAILAAGMGPRARSSTGVALTAAVTERLKRRLRAKGVRGQYTLQIVPQQDDYRAILHITPVRASRPLALRYVAHRLGLGMDSIAMVVQVPEIDGESLAGGVLGPFTSDVAQLVAGMQHVFAVPKSPATELPAGKAGELARYLGISLQPWEDCDRVRLVTEASLGDAIVSDAKAAIAAA